MSPLAVVRIALLSSPLAAAALPQGRAPEPHVVVPQWSVVSPAPGAAAPVAITAVMARVSIDGAVATTELKVALDNRSGATAESVLLLPLPLGSVVRSFAYDVKLDEPGAVNPAPVAGVKPSARVLPEAEARGLYESLVGRSRDPGLLEFAGHALARSSVFPVPPRGQVKAQIVYEEVLARDADRYDYVLPRGEAMDAARVPWTIVASVRAPHGVRAVHSPTHRLAVSTLSETSKFVEIDPADRSTPGPLRLSYLTSEGDVASSFTVYAEPGGPGAYFLWHAGLPERVKFAAGPELRRELIVVLDRSASMAGAKMRQAQDAAVRLLSGLDDGEAFNIVDYSDQVTKLFAAPVVKNAASLGDAKSYIEHTVPGGGTNLHGALVEALTQPRTPGFHPIVVLLTDGVPTTGVTSEKTIRDDALARNAHGRRILTVGVGYDVNAPLLDHLADASRGTSVFARPDEDVAAAVQRVGERLAPPLLTNVKFEPLDASGRVSWARVRDVMPLTMPDLYAGDSLLVLGRCFGAEPIRVRLSGERGDARHVFEFTLDPGAAARRGGSENAHVARLWASRRVAELVNGVRMAGASPGAPSASKELVDEIVSLSTRFGILTEYTAFFANDPVDLSQRDVVHQRVRKILADRAAAERTGKGAVAQAVNVQRLRRQARAGRDGQYLDGDQREVSAANLAQRGDKTLFRKGLTWVDAGVFEAATGAPADAPPDSTIEFGTPAYFELARRLAVEGRPSVLAVRGTLLLLLDGKRVLVKPPA